MKYNMRYVTLVIFHLRGIRNVSVIAKQNLLAQVLLLLLFPVFSFADPYGGNPYQTDVVSIRQKSIAGHEEKEFTAQIACRQHIDVIGSILMDIPFYLRWLHNCNQVELLEGTDAMDCIAYFRIDLPWPFYDREVIIRFQTIVDENRKKITIQGTALSNYPYPVSESRIRITDFDFSITLEKIESFRTNLTIKNRIDLKGGMASRVSNMITENSLHLSILNFNELTKFWNYHRVPPVDSPHMNLRSEFPYAYKLFQ